MSRRYTFNFNHTICLKCLENQIYEEKTNSCINISNKYESEKITTDDLVNNKSNNSTINEKDHISKTSFEEKTDINNSDGLTKSSEEIGEKKSDKKNNEGISKTSEEDKNLRNIAENKKIHIFNLLFIIINLF